MSALLILMLMLLSLTSSVSCQITVEPSNCTSGRTNLDNALQNINFRSNELVQLLPGDHCINTFNATLEGLKNVTITGVGNVTVHCIAGRGLAAFNTTEITISNITFNGCGANNEAILDFFDKLNDITYFIFNISSDSMNNITFLCGHCKDFKLSGVTINGTLGLGFLGVNLIGNSVLEDTVFAYNVPTGCFSLSYSNATDRERIGGGALLIYADYKYENYTLETDMFKLSVVNSSFLYNSYCSALYVTQYFTVFVETDEPRLLFINGGGGLSLKLTQFNFRVNYSVSDSVFQNNTARGGAGASVQVFTGVYNSSIDFSNCEFTKNGLAGDIVQFYAYVTSSSGLEITTDLMHPRIEEAGCIFGNISPSTVTIRNSNFVSNRAFSSGGVGVFSFYSPGQRRQFPHKVIFESCRFIDNYAYSASALFIQEWKYIAAQPGLVVFLRDVEIKDNNNFMIDEYAAQSLSGIVHVVATNLTLLGTNLISNNTDTGVYLDRSILHMEGETSFINNSAARGAGIRFESQSLLILSNNSELNFVNNKASVYGAGIYSNNLAVSNELRVVDCPIYFGELSLLCFQDFSQDCTDVTKLNITIRFEGNTAQQGNMIYGTTLKTCPWAQQLTNVNENIFEVLYMLQQKGLPTPIQFDTAPNTSAAVATNPFSIVIENGTNQTEPILVVPGRTFNVHVEARDQFDRLAYAVITSLTEENGELNFKNHSLLGDTNYWLLSGNERSSTFNVPVTVYIEPTTEDFRVVFIGVGSYAQNSVKIRVIDCPLGYVYNNDTKTCNCDPRFNNFRTSCNNDDTLSIPTNSWIGYAENYNKTILTIRCYLDYCKSGAKNVSLKDVDAQCSDGYNRGGIGCGGCKEGFGLTLGENRCKKCSSYSIFNIIGFAGIGIGLISVFGSLRISIADGYLNGILFFSNVITLFSPVFSVQSETLKSLLRLFSWLNLNIGFEYCFYEGMTALQQSTLSFVFPVYLYILIGLIILLSKYSQKFARSFNSKGYSATKLFATLFVMTYTTILSNSINILGYSIVYTLDGVNRTVWITDPNQPYFEGFHAVLCVFAILMILVYLIPAPLILVAPGLVLRIPILKNYKPLYDAFWAPFKPQFRFWIGLRLMLRFFPFIFSNFIGTPTNVLFLTTFLLTLCFAQAVLQPYEGRLRNASDMFLLFDLVIITVGYLHFFTYDFNSRNFGRDFEKIVEMWESAYFISSISVVYILLLIFIVVRIFIRFPILKLYAWKAITTIFFCESIRKCLPDKAHIEQRFNRKRKVYGTTSEEPATATDPMSIQSELPNDKNGPATFSELREPLLDSSGELEVVIRHTKT